MLHSRISLLIHSKSNSLHPLTPCFQSLPLPSSPPPPPEQPQVYSWQWSRVCRNSVPFSQLLSASHLLREVLPDSPHSASSALSGSSPGQCKALLWTISSQAQESDRLRILLLPQTPTPGNVLVDTIYVRHPPPWVWGKKQKNKKKPAIWPQETFSQLYISNVLSELEKWNRKRKLDLMIPFFFFFFCLFMAVPAAYGRSQARVKSGAIAASLHHSHCHTRSETHLQPTPQLTATLNP